MNSAIVFVIAWILNGHFTQYASCHRSSQNSAIDHKSYSQGIFVELPNIGVFSSPELRVSVYNTF